MSRTSAMIGVAAALALLAGGPVFSQTAPTQPIDQSGPPPLRYSTQISPAQDQALDNAPPAAAPVTPVTTAPAPSDNGPPPPRYASMIQPQPESVVVTGLRPSESEGYRLDTGDTLRLTVFGEPDLSGSFVIDSQGYVRLPLIGQVQAAGLTTYGLETRIANSLVTGNYLLNPRVNVEVTTYRPFYIVGEVGKPGEYAYVNAMTAQNAVALAGGFTDRAVESTVYIRHQGDLREYEVALDQGTRIRPGDVIRVRRSAYWSIMTILAPIISPFSTIAYLIKP
jgi:protein involved in polysaccharide export with SLBB domain